METQKRLHTHSHTHLLQGCYQSHMDDTFHIVSLSVSLSLLLPLCAIYVWKMYTMYLYLHTFSVLLSILWTFAHYIPFILHTLQLFLLHKMTFFWLWLFIVNLSIFYYVSCFSFTSFCLIFKHQRKTYLAINLILGNKPDSDSEGKLLTCCITCL